MYLLFGKLLAFKVSRFWFTYCNMWSELWKGSWCTVQYYTLVVSILIYLQILLFATVFDNNILYFTYSRSVLPMKSYAFK